MARRGQRVWMRRVGQGAAVVAVAIFACLSYSWIMLPDVRPLRTKVPDTTAFMQQRAGEAARAGRSVKPRRQWLPYRRISPTLRRAVLSAEDAGFWDHDGVDLSEIQASIETYWDRGGPIRGGSTITQQLAKNLYLSASRNPYRKLVELMIARRLEAHLSKERILELYLNLIEWGDGIWGADAAARAYFGRSATDVSVEQAALLAGAIINPRIYSPAHPNARLLRRQQIILRRLRGPARPPQPPESIRLPVESAVPTLDADGLSPAPLPPVEVPATQ